VTAGLTRKRRVHREIDILPDVMLSTKRPWASTTSRPGGARPQSVPDTDCMRARFGRFRRRADQWNSPPTGMTVRVWRALAKQGWVFGCIAVFSSYPHRDRWGSVPGKRSRVHTAPPFTCLGRAFSPKVSEKTRFLSRFLASLGGYLARRTGSGLSSSLGFPRYLPWRPQGPLS